MVIANFTPDTIEWWHMGINGFIKPDEVVEMSEGRARFILNKLGRRGLVQMNYGDEEEPKRELSMKLWREFWEHQITMQNQHNEDQKEKGQRYAKPSEDLVKHADMLDIELLKPWTVSATKKDSKAVEALREENAELKSSLKTMQDQMTQLMAMMAGNKNKPEPPAKEEKKEDPVESNRKKYRSLREGTMKGWVKNHFYEISDMPEENRNEIESLYEDLYKEPFPSDKPE